MANTEKKTSPKRDLLLEKQKNGYDRIEKPELKLCDEFNGKYKDFINAARTERLATEYAAAAAEKPVFTNTGAGSRSNRATRSIASTAERLFFWR